MKIFSTALVGVLIGAFIGAAGVWWLAGDRAHLDSSKSSARKPLYWVAPMDPNYKRDQPGKSPMGMDLVPVYADDGAGDAPGTVVISPEVVNNLGVRTAEVSLGDMVTTIHTVGYVQYDENRLVHIHPRVEGWIETLHVTAAGDPVEQGAPLYDVYSPNLVNAQEELLLALKRDNPTLIQAAVDRLVALQVSQADIERVRRTRRVAQTITVAAPQSGVLENLAVREGMFVSPGMRVMAIGQLEHIWVIGDVFERQSAQVQPGDAVHLQLDYLPGRRWHGKIDYIYPSLNAETRTTQVRVHIDNPDGYLKPGMFARMEIETQPIDEVLLIPREALIRTGGQSRVVRAMGEGRFRSVVVEVGRIGTQHAEILSGLAAGERIVTSAQFLLDSESSKTADFLRMGDDTRTKAPEEDRPDTVWVAAEVQSVMPDARRVRLRHEPIAEWDWPAMSMDFVLDGEVSTEQLHAGMRAHVEISRRGQGDYRITGVHVVERGASDAGSVPTPPADQHQHDHGDAHTGHGAHQEMEQGSMDMDHSGHERGGR